MSPDEYDSWKETVAVKSQPGLVDEIKNGLQQLKDKRTRLYTLEDLFEEQVAAASCGCRKTWRVSFAECIRGSRKR